jgi:hypothetical protein
LDPRHKLHGARHWTIKHQSRKLINFISGEYSHHMLDQSTGSIATIANAAFATAVDLGAVALVPIIVTVVV